ncbi:TetR/AcrR family transcriptional regulator [Nocardia sp. JMUB6875]|uniref:TetR/AcrR family transcriptional regulator n=1 Tax=Nocardia sp. JMUB6875 TaxID=3158170 RepID=UPI0032E794B3
MKHQPDARPAARARVARNTVSEDLVVDAALRLLDAQDFEQISMRALAAELGVGTMTVYTYFRSKDELLQAVRNRVLGGFHPPTATGEWYERVAACCLSLYEWLIERPAVLRVLFACPPTEGDFAATATTALELILFELRRAGLDRLDSARGYATLLQYTFGAALRQLYAGDATEKAGHVRARLDALSPELHPTIVDLASELARTHENSTEQYVFGLDLIVTGLRVKAGASRENE